MSRQDISRQIEEVLQRARPAFISLCQARLIEVWDQLRQAHKATRQHERSLPVFPYWIKENIPEGNVRMMLTAKYGSEAHYLDKNAPRVYQAFGVPEWQVVLYFGNVHQNLGKSMTKPVRLIQENRLPVSFDDFYRSLKQIRASRIGASSRLHGKFNQRNALGFTPRDFKTYTKSLERHMLSGTPQGESHDEDDSDEAYHESGRSHVEDLPRSEARMVTRASARASRSGSDFIVIMSDSETDDEADIESAGIKDPEQPGAETEGLKAEGEAGQHSDGEIAVQARAVSTPPRRFPEADGLPTATAEKGTSIIHERRELSASLPTPSAPPSAVSLQQTRPPHGADDMRASPSLGRKQSAVEQVRQEEDHAATRPGTSTSTPVAEDASDEQQQPERSESLGRLMAAMKASIEATLATFEAMRARNEGLCSTYAALKQEEHDSLRAKERLARDWEETFRSEADEAEVLSAATAILRKRKTEDERQQATKEKRRRVGADIAAAYAEAERLMVDG